MFCSCRTDSVSVARFIFLEPSSFVGRRWLGGLSFSHRKGQRFNSQLCRSLVVDGGWMSSGSLPHLNLWDLMFNVTPSFGVKFASLPPLWARVAVGIVPSTAFIKMLPKAYSIESDIRARIYSIMQSADTRTGFIKSSWSFWLLHTSTTGSIPQLIALLRSESSFCMVLRPISLHLFHHYFSFSYFFE